MRQEVELSSRVKVRVSDGTFSEALVSSFREIGQGEYFLVHDNGQRVWQELGEDWELLEGPPKPKQDWSDAWMEAEELAAAPRSIGPATHPCEWWAVLSRAAVRDRPSRQGKAIEVVRKGCVLRVERVEIQQGANWAKLRDEELRFCYGNYGAREAWILIFEEGIGLEGPLIQPVPGEDSLKDYFEETSCASLPLSDRLPAVIAKLKEKEEAEGTARGHDAVLEGFGHDEAQTGGAPNDPPLREAEDEEPVRDVKGTPLEGDLYVIPAGPARPPRPPKPGRAPLEAADL